MRINEKLMKQHKSMKIILIKRNHKLEESIFKISDKEFIAWIYKEPLCLNTNEQSTLKGDKIRLGVMIPACNPSTEETGTRGSKSKASLDDMRPWIKKMTVGEGGGKIFEQDLYQKRVEFGGFFGPFA